MACCDIVFPGIDSVRFDDSISALLNIPQHKQRHVLFADPARDNIGNNAAHDHGYNAGQIDEGEYSFF